ncbi:MAG: transporter substrate-binding domain-containing protein [Fibromonadaceae bacterium]|jgi:ABC-type amino acid transport substrate-binding protein|nr:transporter substrate-binding domain-containing protein [Fibromonadaceae bacterium]
MRIFALLCIFIAGLSHGRSFSSIRKDSFTVGVSKADSAAEYGFISEITAKMKVSRFRIVCFDNASAGEKLLLDDKIDAIIARISYSPHLEGKFLLSRPYDKAEITVALPSSNNDTWTLSDLNGKNIAFVPKEVFSEQILDILPKAKLNAARGISEALAFLQKGETQAIVASRQTLEAHKASLRIFPNTLAENSIVALFAPSSKALQEEFDKAMEKNNAAPPVNRSQTESKNNADRIKNMLTLLNELKKEIETLQKEGPK